MLQNEARPDHTKIKAPALMITVVNPGAYVVKQLQNLSEERQNAVDDFLAEARQMKEKEIELFRKTIPNGRVVMLTNADHHCFIDREDEVLREMRAFLAPTSPPRVQISLPVPVDVEIPMPPTPVKADGKWWLVYELQVTNFDTNKIELVRVEVLKDGAKGPMATYTDEELSRRLKPGGLLTVVAEEFRIESSSDGQEHQVISRGNRAVMYMLTIVQQEADIPSALHHRLFFKSHSAAGNSQEVVVEGARVPVNRKTPLVLSAPLRGEGWVALSGPSNDNRHRRIIFVKGGKARIPARFAIDWTRIDANGRFVHGDRANNANWYSYGAEVLAVANAVVADVKDGIPDNEMGSGKKAAPITPGTIAGNYVMLDLGKSNFAVYAHLQPKSIRVRVGEKVRRGQVLGLLGNSGDSGDPHLHFHVANANSIAAAEGVPYVFESFEVQGVVPSGQVGAWKPPSTAKADKRRREMPTNNMVIRFP
jgi:murein DD-endopeptidase MepM/ murein hydrolase activator NlpD